MSEGTEIKQAIDSSSPFLTVMFQTPVAFLTEEAHGLASRAKQTWV